MSLLVIISSHIIFNTNGELNEKSLTNFNSLISMEEILRDIDLHAIAPKILWLLRNYKISEKDKSKNLISSNLYLERFLMKDVRLKKKKIKLYFLILVFIFIFII